MLKVENVDLYYGDAQALEDINLHVDEGEIIAIIGANGAGKTSLIKAIAGIHTPSKGSIEFRDKDITRLQSSAICELGVGQVAEGRQIFPSMSVLENLEMGAVIKRARAKEKETLDQVFEMYPILKERQSQAAGTLSGGEQQMLAIGRCLMGQPDLIMFDEPSLGLAPAIVQEVFRTIHQLNDAGLTVILVEQNVAVSLKLANRAYVLENGHMTLEGSGEELLHDDRVRQAYMGL
ncbi:MAG: ABC transporter ATP-binding protein [Rhodospirillaceae bacterium]|jgi:branched-chain amino acid transport system ATP-binding protein|nr:ABC transporter ATP-binding protein [Rhodospirillaceae bacterium]MBT4590256.1 ABC transporter ATP-binding protein [Rhodospirillaceae bacterium]MBT4939536.1 ABC transporter ATP-binding protein [Rhodospirillaceae bacterium]MBT5941126.1 ABC transporter ATP-binding protein [Rhodospirillaceae bacterium]MBT7267499.1 ABC transporter ATP-binding protein [Rhodospirillaceae bacterium]